MTLLRLAVYNDGVGTDDVLVDRDAEALAFSGSPAIKPQPRKRAVPLRL